MRRLLGRLRQGRFLAFALIAMGGAALSAACSNHCPDFESPCPEPFEVGKWCASAGGCTMDGASAECDQGGGCELRAGEVFSIPIAQFAPSLDGQDLYVRASYGGCDITAEIGNLWAAIDGIPGSLRQGDGTTGYFEWGSFPSDPARLEMGHGSIGTRSCVFLKLSFVDGACDRANPPQECSL